jgi:hypothetical protein
MRDMLKSGMQWLAGKQREHQSSEIVYRRGSSSITLRATRGRSEFEAGSGDGAIVRVETADFIVHVSDLRLDGILEEPKRGDEIIEGTAEDGHLYEVLPGGNGVPSWRFSDDYHTRFRIHTKYVRRLPA